MPFAHTPVMLNEVVALFREQGVTRFIDGTLGGAGHSSALLEALPNACLLGIDQDPAALEAADERLAPFGKRATIARGNFSDMDAIAEQHDFHDVDGVLLDIGVSSPQIDTPERGFSLRFDGPLDMRMDPDSTLTAAFILNNYSEKELADIFYQFGEERKSRQVARAVVARRQQQLWERTGEFAELVESIVGKAHQHGLNPATRCFQALRIAVNDELGRLEKGLKAALNLLKEGGIIAVITFHSLEDRIAKDFFNYEALTCTCPPGMPICTCGKVQRLKVLTKKPVRPSDEECAANPRAACAKLRAAQKTTVTKER
ncbi:MAG: 16S rRNA (cytosine(1402)-N(4))-methyltransferase RsmH [Victivallales bacterium]|nr:16S rRNA (cytosine(1402)-N(4))-methyltransferase RsmH [Victivallales bacterium]